VKDSINSDSKLDTSKLIQDDSYSISKIEENTKIEENSEIEENSVNSVEKKDKPISLADL